MRLVLALMLVPTAAQAADEPGLGHFFWWER